MKITLFEVPPERRKNYLRLEKIEGMEVKFVNESLTKESVKAHADAEVISSFIFSSMSRDVLSEFKQLKYIATRSTGYDHIDCEFCREKQILASNVPVYGSITVAEHAFGLILNISRKISDAIERTRKGVFSREGLKGFDLEGKTIGVIGVGNIGKSIVKMAKGFGMRVLGSDIYEDLRFAREMAFEYQPLEDVLKQSDIICLSVPGTPETENLIAEKELSLVKEGAIIINVARGTVLDSTALLKALNEGRVAAAGLDVLPEENLFFSEAAHINSLLADKEKYETLLANHLLLQMPNVYVTPHNAFNTAEALQRIIDVTIDNIIAFAEGKPQNLVTRE